MRLRFIPLLSLVVLFLVIVSQPLLGQECTQLIQEVYVSLTETCIELGGAAACAGSNTRFNEEEASAGDIVPLADVNHVANTSEDGVALVNTYGNVPLALSNSGIHFVLVGEASIENQVDSATAFSPVEAVNVTTFVGANLRSSPSTDGRVIGSAAPGAELIAFGMSSDQQWLLALFDGGSVWISRQVVGVSGEGDLDSLPVIRGGERSLMQAFQLTNAATIPACVGTPPSLLVLQGPEGFGSVVEVNGVEIRFTSTIALRINEENRLQLIVLGGGATSNNLPVPAGFTMFMGLDNDGLGIGGWTGLRPITGDERALLTPLEGIPSEVWYTALTIPTAEQVSQTLASLGGGGGVGQATSGPAAGRADCANFRPTSPMQQMGNRPNQPFYWDGAPGANGYRVNIFNETGNQVGTITVGSQSTTATTNTTPPNIGDGSTFTWEVQALVDGQVACTTGRASVLRDAVPIGIGGGGGGNDATPTACPWTSC